MAKPFSLYNTLTKSTDPFEPIEAGKIRLYVCGMTVYDRCHVGHARAMVVFDAFVRYLRHRGWDVHFVRNFTDVDDKIIRRANELGEDPLALAARYIEAFREDAAALGLLEPDEEPRVSTSIEAIIGLITSLLERGHAYVEGGNVWFAVESFPEYGKLSRQKVAELQSADAGDGKRAPADFALWKAAKPGEPSWPSPWGRGRPGWHIECSAMSKCCLGDTIDIHGGGLDLVFPHHENEIAQSEGGNGVPFARWWMHNGLLTMTSGQKMGKSLGNVINVSEALEAFPAEALRLYYLQNHYRSPLPWNEEALPEALSMTARLYEAREQAEGLKGAGDPDKVAEELGAEAMELLELGRTFPERFYAALDEDFSTGQALGFLFQLARGINRLANTKAGKKRGAPVVAPALEAFALASEALGLMSTPTAVLLEEIKEKRLAATGVDRARVEALVAERCARRQARAWDEADRLRAELEALNVVIMDNPDGSSSWRVRV